MKVMRIHIRRVGTCSALMFGLLVAVAFFHDSFLFFGSGSPDGKISSGPTDRLAGLSKLNVDSVDTEPLIRPAPRIAEFYEGVERKGPVDSEEQVGDGAVDQKDSQEVKVDVDDGENEEKDHLDVGDVAAHVVEVAAQDVNEEDEHNRLHEEAIKEAARRANDPGNQEGKVVVDVEQGIQGTNKEDSPQMYDWWEDFGSKAFRGEKIPDDILAVTPPKFLPNYKNPCFYVKDPNGDIVLPGEVRVLLKCLPYFHLIGVDKSGTTDLWFRLTRHKQIVENSGILGKETHWWSWRRFGFDIWVRNAKVQHFNWYIDHFDKAGRIIRDNPEIRGNDTYYPVITGEGSPTVFWDFTGWDLMPQNKNRTPETALLTPHCIHHLQPQAKLLLVLRNPVERMFSEYLFLDRFKSHHNISASLFHEGVQQSIAMFQDCVKMHSTAGCLYNKTLHMHLPVRIMVGMYSVWLKEWFKVFPREQILILRNEDYAADLAGHLKQVFDFLDLSPLSQEDMDSIVQRRRAYQRSESEKAVGEMLPATRRILTDFYASYNKELATLLADDRYLWL